MQKLILKRREMNKGKEFPCCSTGSEPPTESDGLSEFRRQNGEFKKVWQLEFTIQNTQGKRAAQSYTNRQC